MWKTTARRSGPILQKGKPGETYNIGGGNQPANLTVIRSICEILDELPPEFALRAARIAHPATSPTAPGMTGAMPWTSPRSRASWAGSRASRWTSGLVKTVEWYLSHPEWIEAIRQQQDYQGWLEKNYGKRGESE